jgi:hypothetical protein
MQHRVLYAQESLGWRSALALRSEESDNLRALAPKVIAKADGLEMHLSG